MHATRSAARCARSAAHRPALAGLLEQLMVECEVMRRGGNAALSSAVELDDAEIEYLPL